MRLREGQLPRVIQMMPANGWRAVWANLDGEPWDDVLVCWVLIDYTDMPEREADFWPVVTHARQAIVGTTADSDGWIDIAEGDNFLGFSPPDESLDVWKVQAQEYADREKKRRETTP